MVRMCASSGPQTCASRLASAVARYRGNFLEGFTLRDSTPWDEWQALEAQRFGVVAGPPAGARGPLPHG